MIAITGGAGFIGTNLTEFLLQQDYEVTIFDHFTRYRYEKFRRVKELKGRFSNLRIEEMELRDNDIFPRRLRAINPKYVIHLAARAGVREGEFCSDLTLEENLGSTNAVLKVAKTLSKLERFIFASSSTAGSTSEDRSACRSIYGVSKRACEDLVEHYAMSKDVPCTVLRLYSVYGPHLRPDLLMRRTADCFANKQVLRINGDGSIQRDFTHVSDICWAFLKAFKTGDGLTYADYDIGAGHPYKVSKVVDEIAKLYGIDDEIKAKLIAYDSSDPADVPLTHANTISAKYDLGWEAQVDLQEGLSKFVEWHKGVDQCS